MPALTIDTREKSEVLILALFNYKPMYRGRTTLTDEAAQAQKELLDDMTDIVQNWYSLVEKETDWKEK